MQKPTRRTTALTALSMTGAAVGLGLALIGSPAQAEDPTPAPSSSSSLLPGAAGKLGPGGPGHGPGRAQHQDELAAALATELGVDKAKVTAALEKIAAARKPAAPPAGKPAQPSGTEQERKAARIAELKTRLDAAVTAGTLTAEESAAILKAAEAGVLPAGGGPRGVRPGR